MAFSKGSAIGQYKAAARKIARDRKRGVTRSAPEISPAAMVAPYVEPLRVHTDRSGAIMVVGYRGAIRAAGFDTREEAAAWIVERQP